LQDAIREAGAIPLLVRMLESTNEDDVLQAAGARDERAHQSLAN
jgi:hypothetical protein